MPKILIFKQKDSVENPAYHLFGQIEKLYHT